jgi:hypothetical protein
VKRFAHSPGWSNVSDFSRAVFVAGSLLFSAGILALIVALWLGLNWLIDMLRDGIERMARL